MASSDVRSRDQILSRDGLETGFRGVGHYKRCKKNVFLRFFYYFIKNAFFNVFIFATFFIDKNVSVSKLCFLKFWENVGFIVEIV